MRKAPYSLWLLPPEDLRDRFAALIERLSRQLGTPRFEPHLTLAPRVDMTEAEAITRTALVARQLAPLPITLSEAGYADQYFRCLFLKAGKNAPLLDAHRHACEKFGLAADPDFMPHLSLAYGEIENARKEALVRELGKSWPETFLADRICLCAIEGTPDSWRPFGFFRLAG